jgi:hypothetical protein
MQAEPAARTALPVDDVASKLVRQLDRSLDGHKASGDAFVASIYGEWGVGKTYCLQAIHDNFQARATAALAAGLDPRQPLVVPAWFAPWRYEHEEHLVVPMLKTIEHTLSQFERQVLDAREAARDAAEGTDDFIARNEAAAAALKRGAATLGRLAQAMLSAVKFKAAPLGIGIDIDPKSAIEQSQKAATTNANGVPAKEGFFRQGIGTLIARIGGGKASASERESIYFDAQAQLESLTSSEQAVPLRLVVLVDDLDRCLPEKAVQVLESVKLFLNVPGFSFVLAVDDEVVERGIAHRYRDYRLADRDGAFLGSMPISGSQYLEKIVHLPVQLPRWTTDKARHFLQTRYPDLYGPAAGAQPAHGSDAAGGGLRAPRDDAGASVRDQEAARTLQMVLDAVPLVPRKLIRLSEGIEYLRLQFADQSLLQHWSRPHALRVVAMQQLHPVLYRHLRQRAARYWRLFDLSRDAWGEPRYRDGENLAALKLAFEKRDGDSGAAEPADKAATRQQVETLREKLDLLDAVQHSGSQRGAGDPVALFAFDGARPQPDDLGLTLQSFSDLYFSGQAPPSATAAAPPSDTDTDTDTLPEATVADIDEAVAALMLSDAVSRREYIERHHLSGKRLPAEVMTPLLATLDARGDDARRLVLDTEWLHDLAQVTSPAQLLMLYDKGRVVERWVDELPPELRR